jgi:hypothetical protein
VDLFQEFATLVGELRKREIPYALAGALAVAVYGAPRATTDIDIVVQQEDLERLRAVAHDLGFDLEALPMTFESGIEVRRFTKLEDGDALTLDLLVASGPLRDVFSKREERDSELGVLTVVSLESLIAMKTLAGRPRDLEDIRRLRELDA